MNQKRVNKWAFISFVIGVLLTIISMLLIHSSHNEVFDRLHWLVTLIVAIPWVVFIVCLFVLLFVDKR
ncbi:hypothetical protein L3V82_09025 [Thiotrichales bacterium 19S3-7]|nr:hypothetical protein [Thiotrichales bacterium 19S3-7]MCF6802301.1 hypothetical protein [Thiotrichales bacterium 19S3-11]